MSKLIEANDSVNITIERVAIQAGANLMMPKWYRLKMTEKEIAIERIALAFKLLNNMRDDISKYLLVATSIRASRPFVERDFNDNYKFLETLISHCRNLISDDKSLEKYMSSLKDFNALTQLYFAEHKKRSGICTFDFKVYDYNELSRRSGIKK